MVSIVKTRPGLKKAYASCSPEVRGFFGDLPALVDSVFSLDIILAYMFFRLELGQALSLYYGARKLHKIDADLAWSAVDTHHMTRDSYLVFFECIYGSPIAKAAVKSLQVAEKTRDRLMHGKSVTDPQRRDAICRVMDYAARINILAASKDGPKPFDDDHRGFAGASEPLDKATSRWILKGMGFAIR
jgi:hypothetical protein